MIDSNGIKLSSTSNFLRVVIFFFNLPSGTQEAQDLQPNKSEVQCKGLRICCCLGPAIRNIAWTLLAVPGVCRVTSSDAQEIL